MFFHKTKNIFNSTDNKLISQSKELNILKELINKNLIPEGIPYNQIFGLVLLNSTYIITSKKHDSLEVDKYTFLNNIISDLNLFKPLVQDFITENNKETLINAIKNISKRNISNEMDEIEDMAMFFNIPPNVVKTMVKFFDKRYGYIEKNNEISDEIVQDVKKSLLTLAESLVIDTNTEEKKKTVFPK